MTVYLINTDKYTFVERFADLKSAEEFAVGFEKNTYAVGNQKDLSSFTAAQLVSIHNSMVEDEDAVKEFHTKGVALDRVWALLATAETKTTEVVKVAAARPTTEFDGKKIYKLAEGNPRRKKDGNGGKNWDLYTSGMLFQTYVAKREERSDIKGSLLEHFLWDLEKEFIELR